MLTGEQPAPAGADSSAQDAQSVESRILEKFGLKEPDVPIPDESAAEEPEAQAAEEPQEAAEAAAEQPEEQSEEGAPESALVEVELEGKQFRVPAEIKDAVLRQKDYTQKTQETAAFKNYWEAQARMFQESAVIQQEVQKEEAALRSIEEQLQAYRGVDWTQLDTESMLKLRMGLDSLTDKQRTAKEALDRARADAKGKLDAAKQQFRQQTVELVKRAIPDYNETVDRELMQYAVKNRFTPAELENIDARSVEMLYKAWKYDQLQQSKPLVNKRLAEAKPVVKPGSRKTITTEQQNLMQLRKARNSVTTDEAKARLIQKELEMRFSR